MRHSRDPNRVKVTQTLPMEFHYREQLREQAREDGTTVNHIIMEAVQRRYPAKYKGPNQ